MKPLVVIPARMGSKGLPGKNIKSLHGKPLILYTVEAARKVFPDVVICVTTDDPNIIELVENTGLKVPFVRPDSLSTDNSSSNEVLNHALSFYTKQGYQPDTLILLQPTSPFRNENHIKQAISFYSDNLDMLVSVKETKSNPYYVLFEENDSGWLVKSKEGSFQRRQDCPKVFELNGAIYIINRKSFENMPIKDFRKIKKFVMDELSSHDIDTHFDWLVAESILLKGVL